MGAQRPGADVLPPAAQFGRPGGIGDAERHRHNRAVRTPGADSDRRVGSGLVALDSAVMRNIIAYSDPSAFSALGSHLFGCWWMTETKRSAACKRRVRD